MKKIILGLEKDWIAFLFGIVGILLIIFPKQVSAVVPYVLGAGLILLGAVRIIVLIKYKSEANVRAGDAIIDIVLGTAILYHNSTAIGAIGAIWAMIVLYEAAGEITDAVRNRSYSVIRTTSAIISIGLAVLLLFAPFEHFEFHVRILGIEILAYVFIRKHNILKSKTREAE